MPDSNDLKAQVLAAVSSWFDRETLRLRDDHFAYATRIKIQLGSPGGDEDGTLCLDASITEETHVGLGGLRVEGVRFETGGEGEG